jgi:poly(3-hydroxyalkanoate) synthetase
VLPGLEEKDVRLHVADNVVMIRGEKKNEREKKDKVPKSVYCDRLVICLSLRMPRFAATHCVGDVVPSAGSVANDLDLAQYGKIGSAIALEMVWRTGPQPPYAAFFWPALVAASASEIASFMAAQLLSLAGDADDRASQEPEGVTPSRIALELNTVRLRDFSTRQVGVPTLLCVPFALHGAAIADLAVGHSLVATLRAAGIDRLFMADWRPASPDMRFLGIDHYLADLNILVDDIGGVVDLVGLCQGGWLSLIYAARFPAKVRKLVMAGAPVDIAAQQSSLSAVADTTPLAVSQGFVKAGDGRVIGRHIARFWGTDSPDANTVHRSLQMPEPIGSREFARLEAIFNHWNSWTLDLPGSYYIEVIEKLYKRNELAAGKFVALGQEIDLTRLRLPLYLLAGDADEVVAPQQLFALARLAGTRPENLRCELVASDHLGLFMGKRVLERDWPTIVRWMK